MHLNYTWNTVEVRIRCSTAATELLLTDGRVTGAVAVESGTPFTISARCGVVSAAGGFPHDVARRKKLFQQSTESGEYYSLASRGNTGDGLRMAEAGGAAIPGLYAAGTDMASIFGGYYPGPGINLGPAMTFGYIAARHIAQEEESR